MYEQLVGKDITRNLKQQQQKHIKKALSGLAFCQQQCLLVKRLVRVNGALRQ